MSHLEESLAFQIKALQLTAPEREWRFARQIVGGGKDISDKLKRAGLKDWRFDFAWPELKFAVEVEGISPKGGGHQSVGGFRQDIEKYHVALYHGWIVYRTDMTQINNGQAVRLIQQQIDNRG